MGYLTTGLRLIFGNNTATTLENSDRTLGLAELGNRALRKEEAKKAAKERESRQSDNGSSLSRAKGFMGRFIADIGLENFVEIHPAAAYGTPQKSSFRNSDSENMQFHISVDSVPVAVCIYDGSKYYLSGAVEENVKEKNISITSPRLVRPDQNWTEYPDYIAVELGIISMLKTAFPNYASRIDAHAETFTPLRERKAATALTFTVPQPAGLG